MKSLGGDASTTPSARTADQTQIAYFWWESSPLKWSRIARTASANSGFSPWQNARLFALLNMALADGYVAMSATKNHYGYWRPVTAIRAGVGRNGVQVGSPAVSGLPSVSPARIAVTGRQ